MMMSRSSWLLLLLSAVVSGFVAPRDGATLPTSRRRSAAAVSRTTTTTTTTRMALQESSSLLITTAPAWVGPVSFVLDPTLIVIQFMMLCRVLLSWYPEINVNEVPYNLVAWPTEPVLRATRQVVPPAFGVDVSPIVWIAIASLARELLFGQQGFLVLLAR